MILRVRLVFYTLSAAMLGSCLSLLAAMLVIGSNGLSGLPWPFENVVHLAYWPSRVYGTPQRHYFQPHLIWNMMVNTLGWTIAGVLAALLQHGMAARPKLRPDRSVAESER